MSTRATRWLCVLAAAVVVTSATAFIGEAAKPPGGGGSGDTLPPVTPAYNFAVFQDRYADLGGVLDTSTGIVWGYDAASINGPGWSFTGLNSWGPTQAYVYSLDWKATW